MPLFGSFVIVIALIGAALWTRRAGVPRWAAEADRWLAGAAAPWVLALLTGLVFLWMVGWTFAPPAMITDEQAYLLQAKIFTHLRWTAPGPGALADFFSQAYVLFSPVIASKYPPGHSLLLAPGVALGLPWLVPCLLDAAAGGLIFALARRGGRPALGLLTWGLWIGCGSNLAWRGSYFAEITTSAAWLAGWWCTLCWWDTGERRWMILLAAAVGWGAITRPYTMLLYLLPLGAVILWRARRTRRFADLAWGAAAGVLVLAILPLWAWRSTGDWRVTPLERYTATYMPFDRMGFDPAAPATTVTLPADQAVVIGHLRDVHAAHTWAGLPHAIVERGGAVAQGAWGGWRVLLLPAAAAGFFFLTGAGWLAVGTSLLLFLGYLLWGHDATWTVYYVEMIPGLEFLMACGIWGLLLRVRSLQNGAPITASVPVLAAVPLMLIFSAPAATETRELWSRIFAPRYRIEALLSTMPPGPKTVFVRYAPDHFVSSSLIVNDPFLAAAPRWMAYDLGDRDTLLFQAAPERVPYLYDERSGNIVRIAFSARPNAAESGKTR